MPRTRSGWKRYERDVLAPAGGERIPVSGRREGDPDGRIPGLEDFYTEIRSRNRARPLRWMREVWGEARPRGLKPLVVFRGPAPHLSPLVVLRWTDFVEVIRRGQPGPRARPDAGRPGAAGAGPASGSKG